MGKAATWQHRVADTIHERLGLLDDPARTKYKRQPAFMEPTSSLPNRKLTAIGFTSGIGSMLVGAKEAGFRVVGNIEWRDYYRFRAEANTPNTFVHNFPGAFMARGINDVPQDLIPGTIDFAAGHPECGLYSQLRHSVAGRDASAMVGDVGDIPLFLEYVAKLQPRFFLMDDLPDSFQALPMQAYVDLLPDYDLFPEWVSNWGYGNIQKYRNRMFIVGARKSEKFVFVPGERAHKETTQTIIEDLMDSAGDGTIPNHANIDPDRKPGRFVNLRFLGDSATWTETMEYMRSNNLRGSKPYYNLKGELKKRPGTIDPKWDGMCPVLSGGYSPFHPVLWRPLSVRERARIQGFPDDFVFYHDKAGPEARVWEPYSSDGNRGVKQTGKAMPVQFCSYVMKQVAAHIKGTPFKASGERVLKANDKITEAKYQFCKISGYADQDRACNNCWKKNTCDLRTAGA